MLECTRNTYQALYKSGFKRGEFKMGRKSSIIRFEVSKEVLLTRVLEMVNCGLEVSLYIMPDNTIGYPTVKYTGKKGKLITVDLRGEFAEYYGLL